MTIWELTFTLAVGIALGLLAVPAWRWLVAMGRRPRHLRRRVIRRRSAGGATVKPAADHTPNEDNEQHAAR